MQRNLIVDLNIKIQTKLIAASLRQILAAASSEQTLITALPFNRVRSNLARRHHYCSSNEAARHDGAQAISAQSERWRRSLPFSPPIWTGRSCLSMCQLISRGPRLVGQSQQRGTLHRPPWKGFFGYTGLGTHCQCQSS